MKSRGPAVFSTLQTMSNGIGRAALAIEGQGNLVDALILQRRVHETIGDVPIAIAAIQKDQSMREALAAMNAHHVGMLIVFQNTVFAGILCATEVRQAILDEGLEKTSASYLIPAKKVFCISHDDSVAEAIRSFDDHRIKRLIVTKESRPIGILTTGMLLRWIGRELTAMASAGSSSAR
ncbi:CBS domain-containing protein [Thioalkalicoccus limnaeus]|uniref:CBS domain-containing protein n=1 Tax=Thioalkalicoccus limnaeus TaxID=120681 RepID=A0ABV4BEN6_9GAMM